MQISFSVMTFQISRHKRRIPTLSSRKGGAPSSLHPTVKYESGILSSCAAVKQKVSEKSVCHPPQILTLAIGTSLSPTPAHQKTEMTMRLLILFLLTASPFISWQQAATQNQINSDNIPDEVRSCLKTNLELEINSKMNPFLISGDFDGDGFTDFAVQVKTKKDQRKGILVCFAKRAAVVVGAGVSAPWPQKPDDR
jgi:hypothetical protein